MIADSSVYASQVESTPPVSVSPIHCLANSLPDVTEWVLLKLRGAGHCALSDYLAWREPEHVRKHLYCNTVGKHSSFLYAPACWAYKGMANIAARILENSE